MSDLPPTYDGALSGVDYSITSHGDRIRSRNIRLPDDWRNKPENVTFHGNID